jgi:hypothetical protein
MTSMINNVTSRSSSARPPKHSERRIVAVDRVGQVWSHANPLYLYHWICQRNALLRTLEATTMHGAG